MTTSIKFAQNNGMIRRNYTFTSESVSEGHPDKVCDRISDAVIDLFLEENNKSKVACETFATTNRVVLGGEVTEKTLAAIGKDKIEAAVRECIKDIGYEQDKFHHETVEITNLLHEQSEHIKQGVEEGTGLNKEAGAGDQGIMFGYATNETDALMPAPIQYAHQILRELADRRKNGDLQGILGPDAKSQLSVKYVDGKPSEVTSIVLSTQHLDESLTSDDIRGIVEPTIQQTLPQGWITPDTVWHVNPTGKFVIGGPDGDAGLTGRKIIVDTYGGAAPHGGGAFSGKDYTKVDRSAAYAARYLAKNVVAAGLADQCTIQLSYAIGVAKPQSIMVDTKGTGAVPDAELEQFLTNNIDLSPNGILAMLELDKPIYTKTAAYGHFGRTPNLETGEFSWERTDEQTTAAKVLKNFKPMA